MVYMVIHGYTLNNSEYYRIIIGYIVYNHV